MDSFVCKHHQCAFFLAVYEPELQLHGRQRRIRAFLTARCEGSFFKISKKFMFSCKLPVILARPGAAPVNNSV